jgi:hypothetical protein
MKVGDLVQWAGVPPVDLRHLPESHHLCIIVEHHGFPLKIRSVVTGQLFATITPMLEVVSESR